MEAQSIAKSRLIGAVLIETGLITGEQLEAALALQEKTGERLGEIVVAEFGVSRLELAGVLAEQWAELDAANLQDPPAAAPVLKIVEPLTPDEVQIRRPLGEIFVELGFISDDQLESALEAQSESGARIGEILVEQGSLSRLDLASALAEQWSALQKLRPPAPPADPQPWQNGAPIVPASRQDEPVADTTLKALEERLLLIERATTSSLSQADLNRAQLDLRAAIAAVEERLEAVAESAAVDGLTGALEQLTTRLGALETSSVAADLAALRVELGQLRDQPSSIDALADLSAAVERLELRPERADEIDRLSAELGALTSRLDDLADLGELRERLDATAGQAESAETEVRSLASRLDALGDLESRLDEVAASRAADDGAETSGSSEEISALAFRVDELVARVGHVADAPPVDLTPKVDELAARLDEVAAAISVSQTDDLGARISSLEERGREGDGALDQLGAELAELGERTRARLDALGDHKADAATLAEMQRRLDELAGLAEHALDSASIDELRSRLDDLAATSEAAVDPAALEALRASVSALSEQGGSVEALESRIGDLERQLVELPPAGELRDELRSVSEGAAAKRAALADALSVELAELRSRLDGLSSLPAEDAALSERVDGIADRFAGVEAALESLQGLESGVREGIDRAVASGTGPLVRRLDSAESRLEVLAEFEGRLSALAVELERKPNGDVLAAEVAELRSRLDGLSSLPAEDAALSERVDAVASRLESLGSLESSLAEVRDLITETESVRVADALATGARLGGLEASADSRHEALEERLSTLAAELERRLDDGVQASDVADVRERIETLASRTVTDDLNDRVAELARGAERITEDVRSSLEEPVGALNGRLDDLAHALGSQLDELTGRVDGLVGRDELDAAAAKHVEWFQGELAAVREVGDRRVEQLEQQLAELAGHGAQLEQLRADRAEERASVVRLESLLEEGLAALSSRMTDEVAAAREAAEEEVAVVRSEAGSLSSRIDEILGMRYVDLQAARLADERLSEQLDALTELHENDAEAARLGAADLAARLDRLAGSLQADTAAVRAIAEGAGEKLDAVQRRRLEDLAAAEMAGGEIAARIDDLAMRSAASAAEVEHALRSELGALAARFDEIDAAGIESREELRGELERLASSMGWRLEKIEESLAADDAAALRETVADLERRLEGQSALGEEQVRVTERALRKGLASLGERLVDSEKSYVDAGNALRRSIERLGAAVVEADARMADQIPISPLEGCVAFAPTEHGYRLIELPGTPPEIGSTVEPDCSDGPLVVTRYGRSPLPLDGRPCAYLDRV